jgi:transposase
MRTSGFTVEQRRFALWAVEAGWSASAVCRVFGVTRMTYYRWKAELAVDLPAEGRALVAALQPLSEEKFVAAVQALGVTPGGKRKDRPERVSDEAIGNGLVELAERHPDWGYRRMQEYLTDLGVKVGPKRVYRLYQAKGLALHRERMRRHADQRLGHPTAATGPNEVWTLARAEAEPPIGRATVWEVRDAFTGMCLHVDVQPFLKKWLVSRVLRELAARLARESLALATICHSQGASARPFAL